MDKPLWSWKNTFTRLGFTRRRNRERPSGRERRRLRFEPLEERQLLATDLVLAGFYANGSDLLVDYDVAGDTAGPFDIEIYASADGVTADTLLAKQHVSAPGNRGAGSHTATIAADFADPANDYYLLAKLDAKWEALDLAQFNNQRLFEGGAFKAADGTVHVHGTPGKDTLILYQFDTHVDVQLNGNLSVYDGVWSGVHIRAHGADDTVAVHSMPATTTPVWRFGEQGADLLAGTPDDVQPQVNPGAAESQSGNDLFGPLDGGGIGGYLDPSFSGDGIATTNISTSNYIDRGQGIAIQPDGKIVLVGYTLGGTYYDFALARYNSDGTLDSTFNGDGNEDGIITTEFGSLNAYAYDVALQSDGKIVVVGYAGFGANFGDFVVARYNPDGSPDSTFNADGNNDGIITTDFAGSYDWAMDVATVVIGSEERIVVAGYAYMGVKSYDFALARYTSNGTLDSTFNGDGDSDGKITIDFAEGPDLASSMVIQPDGKILVGGQVMRNSYPYDTDFALARCNADGSPDATFNGDGNNDGEIITPVSDVDDAAGGLALQADGKIVAVGYAYVGSDCDFAMVRYTSNGTPDSTFNGDGNNDGEITTPFFAGVDCATGVAVADDGKIVVGGYAYNGSKNYDIALARYLSDGSLDPDFRDDAIPDGKVTTDVARREDRGNCLALDAAKRILVGGSASILTPPTLHDFMVARYIPDDPDIEITGFSVNPADTTLLDVSYFIYNCDPGPFDIAVYAWFDAETPQTLLVDHVGVTDTTPGQPHTLSIPAVFLNQGDPGQPPVYDLEQDYFLMAKVDSQDVVAESNESNNTRLFDGGIFRDPGTAEEPHNIVHVHGADRPYPDQQQYDMRDIVRLEEDGENYYVYVNHPDDFDPPPTPLPPFYSAHYRKTQDPESIEVSQFHIRTHNGNDDVLTPDLGNALQMSGVEVPMWVFGGGGDDLIYGGDAEQAGNPEFCDRLYGGPDDDAIGGRKGPDLIYGEGDNDTLEGWAGSDTIHGGPGNDRIEGWSGADLIYGGEGDDIITGGLDDTVDADSGDEIHGGPGDDRIDGWRYIDYIYGDEGDDEIYGGGCPDWIYGGPGNDNLFGEEGYDELFGGDGDDFLYGGPDGAHIDEGDGNDFSAANDLSNWPDGLPWPELNLFAQTEEVGDDKGPNWVTIGRLADQWDTEDTTAAYGGSQHVLEVNDPDPEDPSVASWFGGVWANEPFNIYVTWAPRADAAANAPFYVAWFGATPVTLGPFRLNQQWAPTAYPDGIWIDDQYFAPLDASNPHGEFQVDGALWVRLTDNGVANEHFIIADALAFSPVNLQNPELPGSHANREENGFYTGLVLEASTLQEPILKRVELAVEGPTGQLAGRSLVLDFDSTVIRVYRDAEMTEEIDPGDELAIGEINEIYLRGLGAGTTDLVLSLDEPLGGRPLSDLLVVNVWE